MGRPRASFLPRDSSASPAAVPPRLLTWALRPRLHVTRIPDPTAAPPAVPGRFSPTPQARTAPEPGSAATLGIRGLRPAATVPQARAALGPSLAARGGRAANRPPPSPQPAPLSPQRRDSGSCGLRPTQAWLRPGASTPRAASWEPWRSRRGRTARGQPSAALSAAAPPPPGPGRCDNCSAAPRRRHTSVC